MDRQLYPLIEHTAAVVPIAAAVVLFFTNLVMYQIQINPAPWFLFSRIKRAEVLWVRFVNMQTRAAEKSIFRNELFHRSFF
jgi:hypothetical protein